MTDRMTDERLAEIEAACENQRELYPGFVHELFQALKTEREYVKELEDEMPSIAGAVGASMYGKRIRELEAEKKEWEQAAYDQVNELNDRIRELEAELRFAVKAWVKPQDELTPDEIIYMMSAREALHGQ